MENEKRELSLFRRDWRGRDRGEAEIRTNHFFYHPDQLDDISRVTYYDNSAAAAIEEYESLIEQLREYRGALADRYAYLSTAPTIPVVKLERQKNSWTKKVTYSLRVFRRYVEDGNDVEESRAAYPGTERNKAISDYRAYVKNHPGIVAEMDIEKPRWER